MSPHPGLLHHHPTSPRSDSLARYQRQAQVISPPALTPPNPHYHLPHHHPQLRISQVSLLLPIHHHHPMPNNNTFIHPALHHPATTRSPTHRRPNTSPLPPPNGAIQHPPHPLPQHQVDTRALARSPTARPLPRSAPNDLGPETSSMWPRRAWTVILRKRQSRSGGRGTRSGRGKRGRGKGPSWN